MSKAVSSKDHVFGYVRVGEGVSRADQEVKIREFAEARGWSVEAFFEDDKPPGEWGPSEISEALGSSDVLGAEEFDTKWLLEYVLCTLVSSLRDLAERLGELRSPPRGPSFHDLPDSELDAVLEAERPVVLVASLDRLSPDKPLAFALVTLLSVVGADVFSCDAADDDLLRDEPEDRSLRDMTRLVRVGFQVGLAAASLCISREEHDAMDAADEARSRAMTSANTWARFRHKQGLALRAIARELESMGFGKFHPQQVSRMVG